MFRRVPFLALSAILFTAGCASTGTYQGSKGLPEDKSLVIASFPVPRQSQVPLNIRFGKASLLRMQSYNDPKPKHVEKAKAKDRDGRWVLIQFFYKNEDYVDYPVSLRVVLLDEKGTVLAEGGRSSALDRLTVEDTISFPIRVQTLDWARASEMKVLATFKQRT